MGDNEGEAKIIKKGSFGYNNEPEQYVVDANVFPRDLVIGDLAAMGKADGQDFTAMDRKKASLFGAGKREVLIQTDDPEIKKFLAENCGAKFEIAVTRKIIDIATGKEIPKDDPMVTGFLVPKGFSEDQVITALHGTREMYRFGLDFYVRQSEADGNLYVVPIKESAKAAEFRQFMKSNMASEGLNVPDIVALNAQGRKKAAV